MNGRKPQEESEQRLDLSAKCYLAKENSYLGNLI